MFGADEAPSFSYSIGLLASYAHPEIIIVGLPELTAHGLISRVASRAAAGNPFDLSLPSDEIIQNYPCMFVEVSPAHRREYALSACWFYGGRKFRLHQLIWPSQDGVFPWNPSAGEEFRRSQPILGDVVSGA